MKNIVMLLIVLATVVFLLSCEDTKISELNTNWIKTTTWSDVNNNPIASNAKTYSLQELVAYFDEACIDSQSEEYTTIGEVHNVYPIEYFRDFSTDIQTMNYLVYPVTEGGTFYVLFSCLVHKNGDEEFVVADYLYVNPEWFVDESVVDSIIIDRSTYEDVTRLLPMTQPILASSGDYSLSLINENQVALIEYYLNGGDSRSTLIVESVSVISRKDCGNYLSWIIETDLTR